MPEAADKLNWASHRILRGAEVSASLAPLGPLVSAAAGALCAPESRELLTVCPPW